MNFVIVGKAERFRGHLGVGGVRALADLRFAALHRDGAVEIQLHPVGRGLERDGEDRRVVPERRHADAPADRAGFVRVGLTLLVVVEQLFALRETFAEGVGIVFVLREAVDIALRHQVLPAVFQRRHADGRGAFVRMGFIGERRLRHAVAAHRARGGAVCVHGVSVALEIVAGIDLRERAHGLGDDRMAVRGIRALIGEALDLARGNRAVLMKPRDDMEAD